jgi:hypothetical protein
MVTRDGVREAGVVRDAGGSHVSARRSSSEPGSRSCARPGCPGAAEATLRFAYHDRQAVIEPLGDERQPQTYDLCGRHAARTRPPHGWTLRDLVAGAASAADVPAPSSERLGGRDTVALLAAALHAAANDSPHGAAAPARR